MGGAHMSALLIRADAVLTAHDGELVHDGGVLVEDGVVAAVADAASLAPRADETVDGGRLLMPGLIDAHSHLRGVALRHHGISPAPLETWICTLAAMTPLPPGDETLIATAELLETGVTAVQGMVHTFAEAQGLAAACAEADAAARAAGIRALLVLGHSDHAERAPEPPTGEWALVPPVEHGTGLDGFARVAQRLLRSHNDGTGLVRWGIGPVAPQWASTPALERIGLLAGGHRLHTHLHESALQRGWIADDAEPVDRLAAAGLLGPALSAAHGVHLRTDELDRLRAAGAALVHCPASNRALRVGTARAALWLRRGLPVALGIDSQGDDAPDMFVVMRAALRSADEIGDPLQPGQVLAMATTGGGAALGDLRLGRIRPGAPADLVGLDLAPDATRDVQIARLVAHGSREAVRSVWVDGRRVVRRGRALVQTADARARLRTALAADAASRAERLHRLRPVTDAVARAQAEARA
ncbi:amidohydrolase family protein [Microbacterium sp. 18062]|uniref:amidohydrolase family protein n=1 Tax=Microbacterium sp. 18062 TaxID=2681410 RepID=UPI001359E8FF|nr:amidohydrolase family protein [Microbacterium sp. 18062]